MMYSSQCSNYTTIDDPTRNINQGQGSNADQSFFNSGPRWIRFEGAGGTQIPTSAVAMSHCSTNAAGWYSGTMPSVPDTTVNGTACFTWSQGDCAYSNQIQVTNCGSYYVYYLSSPPTGGMRYCTTNATNASVVSRSTAALTSISSYIQSLFKKLIN